MSKKLLLVVCVCFVVFFVGCKGDDGAVGPAGPAGPKGDTGATGPAGANGSSDSTSGAGGSIIFFMDSVTTDTSGNVGISAETFFDGATAADIAAFEKGSFQVFIKSQGVYFPLPGPVLYKDGVISYTYYYGVDKTALYFEILRTSQANVPQRKIEELRILMIPAINAGRVGVDWRNYEQAVAALGLSDKNLKKINKKIVPILKNNTTLKQAN